MTDPITALAMTGASTIVAAMATSAWESTRRLVARLFRQGGQGSAAIEAQLDGDAELVATQADPDGAREDLVRPWTRRLAAHLREHPEAAEQLRMLVDQVAAQLPATGHQWVQHVTARSGGVAFGVQGIGSSLHVHQPRRSDDDTA